MERATKQIRAYEDTAEKLYWIARLSNKRGADVFDEVARKSLDARYERIRKRVEAIKAAESGDELPSAVDLGGES